MGADERRQAVTIAGFGGRRTGRGVRCRATSSLATGIRGHPPRPVPPRSPRYAPPGAVPHGRQRTPVVGKPATYFEHAGAAAAPTGQSDKKQRPVPSLAFMIRAFLGRQGAVRASNGDQC